MDLLTIDPRKLKPNPDNPRKSNAGELPDEQLVANIKEIGIIQPPVVRAEDDELVIVAGHRRVRAAITAGFEQILVFVRDAADPADTLRAVSENVVRANLGPVDQWRAIEALVSDNWTEDAIATALALPVRTIKKLRLLAHIHPPMLDYIAKGDMPKEQELRTITAASAKEQASVWKLHKPKRGETGISWYTIANALSKRHMLAIHASFGEDERQAFGITWEEDLFAPADEDSRYTTNVDAFLAAQTAWLESHLPKKAVILPTGDYGEPKLPPKAIKLWSKPSAGDAVGKYLDPRTGEVREVAFRLPKPEPKKGSSSPASEDDGDIPAPVKSRPDITQKGAEMIGDFRTEALHKALLEDPIEDSDLIGLLVTAFAASNVDVRLGSYEAQNKRKALVAKIAEDGRITKDLSLLRTTAREMLATILSCRTHYHSSGSAARIAGDTINADIHLPNMATDEFLSCCSKAALEKIAADLGLTPQARARDTRAAIIAHIDKGHFTHPRAKFALTEGELASLEHVPFDPGLDDDPDAPIEPNETTNEDGSSHDAVEIDPDADPIDQISEDDEDDDPSSYDTTTLVAHDQKPTKKQGRTRTEKSR